MNEPTSTRSQSKSSEKKPQQRRWWKITKISLLVFVIFTVLAGGAAAGYVANLIKEAPAFDVNAFSDLASTTYIYDKNNELLDSMRNDGNRELIKNINEVSPNIVNAFVSAEDKNFYTHMGINPLALMRAAYQSFIGHRIVSGASTITQQTVKLVVFPAQEQTVKRKVQEMVLAIKLEQAMTKNEILVNYLNWIYFGKAGGNNIYGIQAASKSLFGKPASEINVAQAAVLAALLNNPSQYSLFNNLDNALQYQDYVLNRMLEDGHITQEQFKEAKAFDIQASLTKPKAVASGKYPWLTAEVEQRAAEKLMEAGKFDTLDDARQNLFRGGYKVYTTVDKPMQDIVDGVMSQDKLFLKPVTYKSSTGKTIENADQQAGASMIDNQTGAILAVGAGRHYDENQNNHTLLPRQPGSTMKPIGVYGPAIDQKIITAATVIDDVPMSLPNASAPGGQYFPMNYDNRFNGLMTVRDALRRSINIPALKVFQKLTPKVGLEYVKKMGVSTLTKDDENLVAGIGGLTYGLSVEEATSSYTVFPNKGVYKSNHLITKIEDRNGKTIYDYNAKDTSVFSPQTAYIMNDIMRDVVLRGTAGQVGAHYGNYPIAGKTGTTDGNTDAWFIGYTPAVTLGIWVGYDVPKPMSDSEGSRPQVLWKAIMDQVIPKLKDGPQSFPGDPGGIVRAEFCTKSGMLPNDLSRELKTVSTEMFIAGTEPTKAGDVLVKVKYVEIGGKKYLADANTPASIVKEGIFVKREPYKLPNDDPRYKPKDSDMDLPKELNSDPDKTDPKTNSTGTTGLKVSQITSNQVTLSWDSVPDIDGYIVLRSNSLAGPFEVVSDLLKTTTFTDTKVEPGIEYFYQVSAVDNNGIRSGNGTIVNATPGGTILMPPTGVKASPGAVGVTITWQPVPNATMYVIYRNTGGGTYERLDSTSDTSYTDMTATADSSYTYKITSKRDSVESQMSVAASVGSSGSGSVQPPTPIVSNPGTGNELKISWGTVNGASKYILERSVDNGAWATVSETTNLSFTDSGLTGKQYNYRLRVVDASGSKSAPSAVATATLKQ